LTGGRGELIVDEEFQPHDPRSSARLESISGFAFAGGDTLLTSSDRAAIGVLHGQRFVILRWRRADVARSTSRRTRGAMLVSLTFSRRSIELRLSLLTASNPGAARRLLEESRF